MLLQFLKTFLDYTFDVLPYFFLASLVGAILQVFVPSRLLHIGMGTPFAPLFTGLLGALAPLCSCSMIPLARTINNFSRNSYAPVLAFLTTAPVLSPLVLILTFGVLGPKITLLRLFLTIVFAVGISYIVGVLFYKKAAIPLIQGAGSGGKGKLEDFKESFRVLFFSTGKYIFIGLFIAALVKVLLPQNLVSSFSLSPFSYGVISLFSIPVYVCSGEEVPIAKSFYELGLTTGQVLTFIFASTGICVPTIAALFSFLPKRLVIFYTLSWFLFATGAGILTDRLIN